MRTTYIFLERSAPMLELFLNGCANGADVCTRAAGYTLVCSNYELTVALGNATGGASICASAAGNAIVCDFECHNVLPPNSVVMSILAYYAQKENNIF